MDAQRYPLNKLCQAWLQKIKKAEAYKREAFGNDADTAMKFFTCGRELNEHLWQDRLRRKPEDMDDDDEGLPAPQFRILVGKVAELVQLFGPALYHRNPTIVVEPKTLDIPIEVLMDLLNIQNPEILQQAQMQAQQSGQQFNPQSLFPPEPEETINKIVALLLQFYLDYMQRENDKKTHARRAIDEALIKGMGLLWTEQYQPYENGPKLIGSFYDSVDNLLIDPDADTLDDAKWIARKCQHPIWEVAKEYGLSEKFLRGKYGTRESEEASGRAVMDDDYDRAKQSGETNDLIEYYKIYSKMGAGHKLKGAKDIEFEDGMEEYLDSLGMNVFLVVANKVPYPLNMSTQKTRKAVRAKKQEHADKGFRDAQWPVPFWADGSWPFEPLCYHEVPNSPWPMSHIKPGLGYLEFVTWCMSFLVNRIRTSCRTVVSCMKSMESEMRTQILSGKDFALIEVPQGLVQDGDIKKAVHFMEVPAANEDVWKVLDAIIQLFEKATGLNDLLYGAQGGFRSAREVDVKAGNSNVRPDDMANKTEDWLSSVARKEAMAARWLLDEKEVLPVLGKRGAQLWKNYVMSGEIDKVAREFHYRVEAGSTRKPNKETRIANINAALQQWGILIKWSLQMGNVQTVNAFIKMWCEANDVESKQFLLQPPPPPPPDPKQAQIEAEIQLKVKEHELKQQESQQKLQFEREKLQMQLQAEQAKMHADIEKSQLEMQLKREESQQKLELGRAEMEGKMKMQDQQMQFEHQKLNQQMQLAQQQGHQEMQLASQKGQQEMELAQQQGHTKMQLEGAQAQQKMALGEQQHQMGLEQQEAAAQAKIKQGTAESQAKVESQREMTKAKAQAAANKPKPKKKGKPQ